MILFGDRLLYYLMALAELPLRQDLAVTGSVNQHGAVQAIGGVNEKVEGFFDLCKARGLTGTQGVLIPASNAQHLMLRREVIEASRRKRLEHGAFSRIYHAAWITGVMFLLGTLRRWSVVSFRGVAAH